MPRAGHSHRRLFVAMGASSGLLAVLLWFASLLVGVVDCESMGCLDQQPVLTIRLEIQESEPVVASHAPERQAPVDPPVRESTDTRQLPDAEENELDAGRDEAVGPRSRLAPKRDWLAMASESAIHTADELFENEELREKMWRQTRSVMFADTGDFDFHEPAPIIADVEFRVPMGVLGIGITIGGCFIGIPLAGIPVEERTAGPNVIYCKDLYE